MRIVAHLANVSTATLYRYFPSKDALLVTVLGRWLERFDASLDVDPMGSGRPVQALHSLVAELQAALFSSATLAQTLARAYAAADPAAADAHEGVRTHTSELFADTLGAGHPNATHLEIGRILADVWNANVIAVAHGRVDVAQFGERVTIAVELLAGSSVATG